MAMLNKRPLGKTGEQISGEFRRRTFLGRHPLLTFVLLPGGAMIVAWLLALVGIVPCKVTSENGSIRPGDLLVTSSTAGFAMRGTDAARGTFERDLFAESEGRPAGDERVDGI